MLRDTVGIASLACLHCRANLCHHQVECFQHLSQVIAAEVNHQMRQAQCFVGTILIDNRLSRTLDGVSTQRKAQRQC